MSVRLAHPSTGDVYAFSDRRAAVKRRHGWTDPPPTRPEPDPAPEYGGFSMTEPSEED